MAITQSSNAINKHMEYKQDYASLKTFLNTLEGEGH